MPLSKKVDLQALSAEELTVADSYGARFRADPVPRYELPDDGMPARAAYQAVHDELALGRSGPVTPERTRRRGKHGVC